MNTTTSKRSAILACLALAVAFLVTALPGVASAEHEGRPSRQQLLGECEAGRTDSCQFNPEGGLRPYDGPQMLAGSATNCTNFNSTRVINWAATTGTKNTFGVEISATGPLGAGFSASIKASFQREWSWSEEKRDEIRQDVGKKSRVDIYVSKQKVKVGGTYELRFRKRYYGHYYWYLSGEVAGQTMGAAWHTYAKPARANC